MFGRRVTRRARGWRQAARLCLVLPALGGAAGCSTVERLNDSKLSLDTPIDWWHGLQGGRIAQDRPPPPGVNDPYPNLAEVPQRPTPTDAATRSALTAQLAGERDRTERAAARDPIVPAGAPAAAAAGAKPAAAPATPQPVPGRAGAAAPAGAAPRTGPAAQPAPQPASGAPAAPPDADAEPSKAVLDAASAAPAPAPRRRAGGTAPAPAPGAAPLASGPLPALPTGAPPVPQLPGLPASTFAPPAPRPLPEAVIPFARGSAALPDSADPALRALAARRAGGGMVVEAGGDADGAGPDAQAAAVPLGLARAQAIRAALVADGVPASAIRVEAAGLGRTGTARLLP